jgi:hypothetical protein
VLDASTDEETKRRVREFCEEIEAAGGWRGANLVEDCKQSIRALFAGHRTRFVGTIFAPAELPSTIDAYRSQQKR